MQKKTDTSKGPSQRQQRVAELVRHAMADILARGDIQDPVLASHVVTVPEVRMSPDLRIATVYVMPLGGSDVREVIKALAQNKGFLRAELGRRVSLRFTPDLRFRPDETFDEAARIDALLRTDKVRRDLDAAQAERTEDDRDRG